MDEESPKLHRGYLFKGRVSQFEINIKYIL